MGCFGKPGHFLRPNWRSVWQAKGKICNPEQQHALQEAITAYITPALVQAINEAWLRLGQYILDEDAEALSEHIPYWDYATLSKRQS